MDLILDGIKKAFWLLVTFDPEVMSITWLSLKVSGIATLVSLILGISIGSVDCAHTVPRKKNSGKPHQHGHGASAGCGGPLREHHVVA